jgi:hypothetical protein
VITLKIIALFLLADFVTGLFHFSVDQYGKMNGRFMTNSVNLLLIHHKNPRRIVTQSSWEITGGVYKVSILIFGCSLLFGFNWELLLFLLFCANGNMIHKWAHQKKSETSLLIQKLQRYKVIQSKDHHNKHHNGSFDNNYCVMTNITNPFLQRIGFWEFVTKCLKTIKVNPSNLN